MNKRYLFLIIVLILVSLQHAKAEKQKNQSLISGIAVLSIHVSSTAMHDSVLKFLTEKLGLPLEYGPVTYAKRNYAAVFSGNLYLEPCGPFSNFQYASNDFNAIFFGINCDSGRSIKDIANNLRNKDIRIQAGNTLIITDTAIIKQNIYFNIASGSSSKKKLEDSLSSVLIKNKEKKVGIEGLKEIRIGYLNKKCLVKWKNLSGEKNLLHGKVWKINEDQSIRFVKSDIRQVKAIVFKVESLDKARTYLSGNNLLSKSGKNELLLDKTKTFGLEIYFQDK